MSSSEKGTPFFSVVIPTYNRAEFILQAVNSVLSQDFPDFQLLVVDDGSTDNTLEILQQVSDSRLIVMPQENQGRSNARNNGIDAATGAFVCFLDSDDFWEPTHLSLLSELIVSKNNQEALYHSGLYWFYPDKQEDVKVNYDSRDAFSSDVEYCIKNQFAPDTVAISRAILEAYQFDPKTFINEDIELWARIATQFPVFGSDVPTAHLRVHDGNTSNMVEDYVTPQLEVFNSQLNNPEIKKHLSPEFVNDRMCTFRIWYVRLWESQENRTKLIGSIVDFVVHHPRNHATPSLLVTLLHNLPIIGEIVRIFKKP